MYYKHIVYLFCLVILLVASCLKCTQDDNRDDSGNNRSLSTFAYKDDLIFISTIDGVFYAIDKNIGSIKWSFKEDDVIKFPKTNDKPYFLTDPRDGSLYVLNQREGGLKKFPYTIPELVSASPAKSSDGYLYTGDKRDQWLAIDRTTGAKLDALTSETLAPKITKQDENVLFLGRTKYTISMFDINTHKKKFNLTYYDYSTHATTINSSFSDQTQTSFYTSSTPSPTSSAKMNSDVFNYPYYHFTSSSDGLLITLDKRNGELVWTLKLTNPIVAIYLHQNEQLYKLNFAIFSIEALTSMQNESGRYKLLFTGQNVAKEILAKSLFTPTLYVGFYGNSLYAMPAFVFNAQIINVDSKLIEGPKIMPDKTQANTNVDKNKSENTDDDNMTNTSYLGHHSLPNAYIPSHVKTDSGLLIADKANDYFQYYFSTNTPSSCPAEKPPKKPTKVVNTMSSNYLWSLATVLVAAIFPLAKIIYDRRQRAKTESESESNSGSDSTIHSRQSSKKASNTHSTQAIADGSTNSTFSCPEIIDGLMKIGKILYDPKTVLGHGCEGTFVYKGLFENRPVAVKRLLPECYTLADREVELLRDADQHPNVLRYFCTESDAQFRYIALELCQVTLQEYVNRIDDFNSRIKSLTVLEQSTNGLAHLHSLDIVHRDIKPHNVLLSFPNNRGEIIAMISDFGLCKRLDRGNTSFSKRSGATGTEGWIAPELLDDEMDCPKRFTKAIDIFSLGCVYYYVLTYGGHPFGKSISRQANILSNSYKLDRLSMGHCDSYMQKILIEKMISNDPKQRPSAHDLLIHPIFWTRAKTLQFLLDVSDRIEKIESDDPILLNLEKNANVIIKNNWKVHICEELQNDLKKFRQYNGVILRDLLRAIRNKKHHYRELNESVKMSLGSLPDEFVEYFTKRFPKLILHTFDAMQICKHEPILDVYYDNER